MIADVKVRTRVTVVLAMFAAIICEVPKASPQSHLMRREIVRAGPATLQVIFRGKGEPIVFIPSRGRGIEDFDILSDQLAQAIVHAMQGRQDPPPKSTAVVQTALDGGGRLGRVIHVAHYAAVGVSLAHNSGASLPTKK